MRPLGSIHTGQTAVIEEGMNCTLEQALLFCRLIVQFDALADNHWLNPDDEHEDD